VQKGTTLFVEGELTNRSWTDQATGQKRYSTDVNLSNFQLLSSRNSAPQGQQGSVYGQQVANDYQQGMAQQQQAYASGDDDDLPF
jgi:single-strand DNA-binding protein